MGNNKYKLTDVQLAYLLGRNKNLYLGGNSTHFYVEFDSKLDIGMVEKALNKVILRQPMLRTIIHEEGLQETLEEVPYYKIEGEDLTNTDFNKKILNIREELSHRQFSLGEWPMFSIKAYKLNNGVSRLIVDFDMMIIDGFSTEILVREIMEFYKNENKVVEKLSLSFSDYIEEKKKEAKKRRSVDEIFWKERIENFPLGPELMLGKVNDGINLFAQRETIINKEEWDEIKKQLRSKRILPAVYLIYCYSKTLSIWSNKPYLTINMTRANRKGSHKEYKSMIGDFTELIPIDIDLRGSRSTIEVCKEIQSKINKYKRHNSISGIEIMKKVAKKNNISTKSPFPFVFTSMLFDSAKSIWDEFGKRVYQISQTPQVLLDNQVTERDGNLIIRWDYVNNCLDETVVNKMFKNFIETIVSDVAGKTNNEGRDLSYVDEYNSCSEKFKFKTIQELFVKQVERIPNKVALIYEEEMITYKELHLRSNKVANYLINKIGPNKPVGIDASRGIETIINILGILKSGGYYIPIDENTPNERRKFILETSGASILLTKSCFDNSKLDGVSDQINISEYVNLNSIAYVIYTSGSTGNPKGVVIEQKAVVNTIIDINNKFKINENDTMIGVSSLCFDLSVYDIFGSLTSGATLVLIKSQNNIYDVIKQIEYNKVTIWNTVPAIMDLLVSELDSKFINKTLRIVLLSGDWIPLDLPERIKFKFPNSEVISLGGATEASIWSIYYRIKTVNNKWKSIPYGYPLANQSIYVLSYDNEVCPIGVPGEICIGGIGVAKCYQNDEARTLEQFFLHKQYGRLYRTGDYGILTNNGYVQFLGRKDTQVKIRGYRIELGEIENSIKKSQNVKECIVNVVSNELGAKKLCAYATPIECDKNNYYLEGYKRIIEGAVNESLKIPEKISPEDYSKIITELDEMSLAIIINAFSKLNNIEGEDYIINIDKLIKEGKIVNKYRKLMLQWADSLVKYGYCKRIDKGVYKCDQPLEYINIENRNKKIQSYSGVEYWTGSLEFLNLCNKNITEILKEDVNPLTILFPDGNLNRADNIYRFNPVAEYNNSIISKIINDYIKVFGKDKTIRILEVGAGTGGSTTKILEAIKDKDVTYTFTDLSTFFTDKAKEQFNQYDFIEYGLYNIDEYPQVQGLNLGKYDIIIGANVLHDAKIVENTLKHLRGLLTNDGILSMLEVTTNKLFHKVSIGLIDGFSGYNDKRLKKNEPLLSVEEWKEELEASGYKMVEAFPNKDSEAKKFEQHVIMAHSNKNVKYGDMENIKQNIAKYLPNYMIPDEIYFIDSIPLSKNGKVNRGALPYSFSNSINAVEFEKPKTETEKLLFEIICEVLKLEEIGTNINLFTIGADSLKSISILTKLKNKNIELSLSEFYEYPTILELGRYIDNKNISTCTVIDNEMNDFRISLDERWEPFPLSDLQESYFIGRNSEEEYKGIPTAGYIELETQNYNHDKMCKAIDELIKRHDMLRVIITEDGLQRFVKDVQSFRMDLVDKSSLNSGEFDEYLLKVRKEMCSMRLDIGKAPLIVGRVTIRNSKDAIIHFYIDGLIMDGWSFEIFYSELAQLYQNIDIEYKHIDVTFRDYIRYIEEFKKTKKYNDDKNYWLNRIDTLPEAGILPLIKPLNELSEIAGNQIEASIPIEKWKGIETKSRKYGVSPFSVLFTSFAYTIARWNNKQKFMLNIPEFNRPGLHEDIDKIIGVCSAFLLFEVDNNNNLSFLDNVKTTQKQILELKDHNSFSGMEVTREIYRRNGAYTDALVPIVFGMMPETPQYEEKFLDIEKNLLKVKYQENHTSQVWIDINTALYHDRIEFNWNCIEGLMDTRMLKDMVDLQKEILFNAADNDSFWDKPLLIKLPNYDSNIIKNSNNTQSNFDFECFGSIMDRVFKEYKNKDFILTNKRAYTYEEICGYVKTFSGNLKKMGCKEGDKIAIYVGKGIEQIISVLSVVYIGGVYVPMEYTHPSSLVKTCLENIKCDYIVISEEKQYEFDNSNLKTLVPKLDNSANDSEFKAIKRGENSIITIIHTSGSTGIPKAVMVEEKGLLNSIKFTNDKFNVKKDDVAIALTNLAHDMSMYDIFGMMCVGGSVAIPLEENSKDPQSWIELMKKYNITIWNSVPTMMEMLFDEAISEDFRYINNLRVIILGGDYMKVSLADRIKENINSVTLVNVGGPTETTLWNIYHVVSQKNIINGVIPYGKPISNTKYYILNEKLEQVPIGVVGTMYCAGVGVTPGYVNNIDANNEKYIKFNGTGERIYNTGDLGRYDENGDIIFMGREDFQVKIRGKRIELNGISSVINDIEGINNCVVTLDEYGNNILAFYTGEREFNRRDIINEIHDKLPLYMIPKHFVKLEKLPLLANSKIDKKALNNMAYNLKNNEIRGDVAATKVIESPIDDLKVKILGIYSEMLGTDVDLDSDFFMMGGNSLLAMKMLKRIREEYKISITLTEVFNTSTVREMYNLIVQKIMEKRRVGEQVNE